MASDIDRSHTGIDKLKDIALIHHLWFNYDFFVAQVTFHFYCIVDCLNMLSTNEENSVTVLPFEV